MKAGLIAGGAILIVIGILLYVYPVTSVGSMSDVNDLCNSGLGQFGKVLNQQVRESCQTAKYAVLGSYGLMGLGALLVIVGSVLKGNDSSQNTPLSPGAKRTIVIGVGVAVAILVGAFVYQLSLQPNIQASGLNVNTEPNSQFVKLSDQGRVSGSGNFNYYSPKSDSYYLVFSNDFSIVSTKFVYTTYTDKGNVYTQKFEVPAGAYKTIQVYAYSGQSVIGSFNVAGGSGNDVDFYIASTTCSEKASFTFNLGNYGPVNGNAQVTLESDGHSIWSNSYYVETGKQVSESASVTISDCDQHDFKTVITGQKRIG